MPVYEYTCDNGHRFDWIRPITDRDQPLGCPVKVGGPSWDFCHKVCGAPAKRALSGGQYIKVK